MPELPEVETIRQDLRAVLRGKKITAVAIAKPKMVVGSARTLTKFLVGKTVADIDRRAKLLIFSFKKSDHVLLLHLKMTGQLIYQSKKDIIAGGHSWPATLTSPAVEELPNKYSHIIFTFQDRTRLFFNDLRQFGYVELVTTEEKNMIVKTYGIEPLTPDFTWENFRDAITNRTTAIKNVLLNQAIIAGLGNIYVDESCFMAKVRPMRAANDLSHDELKLLYRACQQVIKQAIKYRGTTFNSYRDTKGRSGNFVKKLKVYGRAGQLCVRPTCRQAGVKLTRTKVNGRGTVYCPSCQK